jgi:hypothetical protein
MKLGKAQLTNFFLNRRFRHNQEVIEMKNCIMALAMLVMTGTAIAETPSTVGLTFAEVTKGFDAYGMNFKSSPLSTGEPRMMATADDDKAAAILEVIGAPDNITHATLITVAASDNPSINLGNITCMAVFLHNTMPELKGGLNWLAAATEKVGAAKTSAKAKQQIVQGDKRLKLSLIKNAGMYFLTVQHKDRKESD